MIWLEQLIAEDDLEQDYLEEESAEDGEAATKDPQFPNRDKPDPNALRADRRAQRFHRGGPRAADRH